MTLTGLLDQLGLPGLFVLGIVDGEAAALLGGALSHHGLMRTEEAALTVWAAAALGDNLLFAAGRLSERFPRLERLLARPSLAGLRAKIALHPTASVLSVRFLYGLHGLGTMALGASAVAWLRFAALNLVAVAIWAHLWVWGGQILLRLIHRLIGHSALEISILVVIAAALLLHLYRRRKSRPRG